MSDSPVYVGRTPPTTSPRFLQLNSVATQANISRFELRLLRFFNDSCIPLFTFGLNKQADYVWRNVLPHRFLELQLIRLATYAFACLNLWPHQDLLAILEADNSLPVGEMFDQENINPKSGDLNHIFRSSEALGNGNEGIFAMTTNYFTDALQRLQENVARALQFGTLEDLNVSDVFFLSSLVYAYLGLHPFKIIPVLDLHNDPPLDMLSFTASVRDLYLQPPAEIAKEIIPFIAEVNADRLHYRSQHLQILLRLRNQLHDYYRDNTQFMEISSLISEEIELCEDSIKVIDLALVHTFSKGYPVPVFRVFFLLRKEFTLLARRRHYFALRILYVHCCICMFLCFHMLTYSNIWLEYIEWFASEHSPMCQMDRNLYEYVVKEKRQINYNDFLGSIRHFDNTVPQMTEADTPESLLDMLALL